MQAANRIAGYSLGDADLLRRAMGKKKPEEMAKQRERFVKGALERGHPQKKVEKIFDLMEQFAGFHRRNPHVLQALIEQIAAATSRVQVHTCYHSVRARLVRERGRSNDKMAEEFIPYFGVLIRLLRPDLQIRTRLQVDEARLIALCQEADRHAAAIGQREQMDVDIEDFVDGLFCDEASDSEN